jgi:hypothetical protein
LLQEAHVPEGQMADRRVAKRIAVGLKTLIAPYARNNRAAQHTFMVMLLRVASVHPAVAYQAMLGLGSVSTWNDSDPQPGDSRRAFRPEWIRAADRGLGIVVHRGAGRCVRCETELSDARPLDGRRRVWRDYCGPCEGKGRSARESANQRAVKLVLDSASGVALRDKQSRVRARRIKRAV